MGKTSDIHLGVGNLTNKIFCKKAVIKTRGVGSHSDFTSSYIFTA